MNSLVGSHYWYSRVRASSRACINVYTPRSTCAVTSVYFALIHKHVCDISPNCMFVLVHLFVDTRAHSYSSLFKYCVYCAITLLFISRTDSGVAEMKSCFQLFRVELQDYYAIKLVHKIGTMHVHNCDYVTALSVKNNFIYRTVSCQNRSWQLTNIFAKVAKRSKVLIMPKIV